jgi:exopolysaccharide biosynthesis protein
MNEKLNQAINELVNNIQENYNGWRDSSHRTMNIKLRPGRKFIKIIIDTSVWGFVAKSDGSHKGLPMQEGDVFKPASWASAAKHTRGNVFADKQDYFTWSGPNYL